MENKENKKIRLSEEAYSILINWKKPEETLSDCILRIYGKKGNNQKFKDLKVESY